MKRFIAIADRAKHNAIVECRHYERQLGRTAEFARLCDLDGTDESQRKQCHAVWKERRRLRSKLRAAERRHKFAANWSPDA